jgi:hypothetical protein
MSQVRRSLSISAWMGLALAGWFFYPLASALEGDSYYLQWQPRHSAEALAAVIALAALFGIAIVGVRKVSGRTGAFALLLIAAVPLASLAVGVIRQLPQRGVLISLWQQQVISLGVTSVAAALIIILPMAWPEVFRRWFWRLLMVLSPASLVVLGAFLVAGARQPPPLAIDHPPLELVEATASTKASPCASVLVFLFDELSFSYLYDGAGIRTEFPWIRKFSSSATHHLAVSAPGPDTIVSLPGYLAGRRPAGIQIVGAQVLETQPDGRIVPFDATSSAGLFSRARQLGFRTEIAGYYFAYCEMLAGLVDACRSFSFYNLATLDEGFSSANPVLTTFVLWPRQFPVGLLKNPSFARQQRGIVDGTLSFARRPLAPNRPVLRFVHFSVPHLPFVFDASGYNPPFNPLHTSPDDAYVGQLHYTDRLFGELMAGFERSGAYDASNIVLLSDHGFRFGGREGDPRHIPFIVKAAGQRERADVTTAERGELLLQQVVEAACGR